MRSLPSQWSMQCDGGQFLVFEIRLDGLNHSIPSCSVQKNRGGGAVGLRWSCPVGRGIFACLVITMSICTNVWPVTGHPTFQRQSRPMQHRGHERYLLGRRSHI